MDTNQPPFSSQAAFEVAQLPVLVVYHKHFVPEAVYPSGQTIATDVEIIAANTMKTTKLLPDIVKIQMGEKINRQKNPIL